ncbi:MAG: hypothetical protein ACRDWT_03020 [Jatrophihabitantaceae bacterium]
MGTTNDGDWSGDANSYAAATRGKDWATQVITPLATHASATPGIVVEGGIDIEAGFASTEADAETWILKYLAYTSGDLVEHGSADNCPTAYGSVGLSCGPVKNDNNRINTWTQMQYYRLAHRLNAARIVALPQIYSAADAARWENIDRTGVGFSGKITFVGALTSAVACAPADSGCTSLTPAGGFAALWDSLSASAATAPTTSLTIATDLRSDT